MPRSTMVRLAKLGKHKRLGRAVGVRGKAGGEGEGQVGLWSRIDDGSRIQHLSILIPIPDLVGANPGILELCP